MTSTRLRFPQVRSQSGWLGSSRCQNAGDWVVVSVYPEPLSFDLFIERRRSAARRSRRVRCSAPLGGMRPAALAGYHFSAHSGHTRTPPAERHKCASSNRSPASEDLLSGPWAGLRPSDGTDAWSSRRLSGPFDSFHPRSKSLSSTDRSAG